MGTFIGLIVGGIITLLINYYLKERDTYLVALNSAKILDMVICEQLSTLANVSVFVTDYENQKIQGKLFFSKHTINPGILSVTNDLIDRLYSFEEVRNYYGSGRIIIGLTASQRLYNQLFKLFDSYNNSLSPSNIEKIMSPDTPDHVKEGYTLETYSIFTNIKYKYNELELLNLQLKEKFNLICKTVFIQEAGLCKGFERFYNFTVKKFFDGHSYKPIEIKNEKIEIKNIFNE